MNSRVIKKVVGSLVTGVVLVSTICYTTAFAEDGVTVVGVPSDAIEVHSEITDAVVVENSPSIFAASTEIANGGPVSESAIVHFDSVMNTEVMEINERPDIEDAPVEHVNPDNYIGTGTIDDGCLGTPLGTFKLTAYCSCRICNGSWVGQPTALGTDYVAGRTIAVDRRVIPLGTWVYINIPGEGWHKYRAEDTGSAIKGNRIDIYIGDVHSQCLQSQYNVPCEVRLANY